MTCGIYIILNNKNGSKYIGQSQNIEKRWRQHKKKLDNNKHYNTYLQNSWNKYGKNSFSFMILESCHKNALNSREQYWIRYHNTYNNKKHYNLTPGGDSQNNKSKKHKHSKKTKNKTSKSVKYFRVCQHKREIYKQGFIWRYRYHENGKTKDIESVDLKKLEKKVKAKGLEWRKL